MKDYVVRMVEEEAQLNERITKLRRFMSTEEFKKLPLRQRSLLNQQCILMQQYDYILKKRICLEV